MVTVSMLQPVDDIDLAPQTVMAEVIQNVRCIMSTPRFSIPLDRSFSIDGDVVDLPLPEAEARMANEIFRALRRYEPRARIETVRFEADIKGKLKPILEVSIYADSGTP